MPRRGYTKNKRRSIAYRRAYAHYNLGIVPTFDGYWAREGFLYQEPNPDYDKWLPENCTPILFKDWIKDKIPPDLPKPKIGKKSRNNTLTPRPVICVETGKFYYNTREACKEYHIGCLRSVCCGDYPYAGLIFAAGMRWTYVDPFMEWDDQPWTGIIKQKNHNPNSCRNRVTPLRIEETGEEFGSIVEAAEELQMSYGCIKRALSNGKPYNGLTFLRIK